MTPDAPLAPYALVYVTGAPAVGKTTLVRELTAGCRRLPVRDPFAYDVLLADASPVGVELGRRRDVFGGTDALSMSVQPKAVAWIGTAPTPLVVAEGDRLGNAGFLNAARDAGYTVTLIHLTLPPDALAARAQGRGAPQDPSWARGRATKATNLAAAAAAHGWGLISLDATAPAEVLAARLRDAVPALRALTARTPPIREAAAAPAHRRTR